MTSGSGTRHRIPGPPKQTLQEQHEAEQQGFPSELKDTSEQGLMVSVPTRRIFGNGTRQPIHGRIKPASREKRDYTPGVFLLETKDTSAHDSAAHLCRIFGLE